MFLNTSKYSDYDQYIVPDGFANRLSEDIHVDFFRYQERERERLRTEQRVLEKNNQIRELTTLVKTLTEHVTSSRSNSERKAPAAGESAAHVIKCVFEIRHFKQRIPGLIGATCG